MRESIICGFSMEMEYAEIGKCEDCRYYDKLNTGELFCNNYNKFLDDKKDDCNDWVVDIR